MNKGEDNTIYDVTGSELFSYEQVAQIATEIIGKAIRFINVTDEEMMEMWTKMGVPCTTEIGMKYSPVPWSSEDMTSFGRAIREGMMAAHSDAVEKLTGRNQNLYVN